MHDDLHALEQRWGLAIQSAGFGVWDLDLAAQLVHYPREWKALLGYPATDTPDPPSVWRARVHPDDLAPMLAAQQRHLSGASPHYEAEFRLRAADGSNRWVLSRGRVVTRDAQGQPLRMVGTLTDITDRRALEAMRAERDRVAALSQAKSAFLSRLSHELRTPLNAVLGFAQLLALRLGGAEQAPHRHEVAQIEQAGWLLLRKIDDLLDLSQVEAATPAAPLAGVPVAVAACWQQVCDALAPLAAARGVQLQAEVAPADAQVLADPARLTQVLQQLADNAVRHHRPQGTVALRLQREGPQWCLAVQDDGPGIPPEQLACLFEAFERGPQTGAAHDGLGIGLTLARWWVQRMGGSIAAQSTPGQGSTLCVRLPAADGGDPA